MKCAENGNVHTHLDEMLAMHENLTTIGVGIDDTELVSIIVRSLPNTYQNFIAPVANSAHMSGVTLTPTSLVLYVHQEYDQIVSCGGPTEEDTEDVATKAEANGKRKDQGWRAKIVC